MNGKIKFLAVLATAFAVLLPVSTAQAFSNGWTPTATCGLPNQADPVIKSYVENGYVTKMFYDATLPGIVKKMDSVTGIVYDDSTGLYKGSVTTDINGSVYPDKSTPWVVGHTYQDQVPSGHTIRIVWTVRDDATTACSLTNRKTA